MKAVSQAALLPSQEQHQCGVMPQVGTKRGQSTVKGRVSQCWGGGAHTHVRTRCIASHCVMSKWFIRSFESANSNDNNICISAHCHCYWMNSVFYVFMTRINSAFIQLKVAHKIEFSFLLQKRGKPWPFPSNDNDTSRESERERGIGDCVGGCWKDAEFSHAPEKYVRRRRFVLLALPCILMEEPDKMHRLKARIVIFKGCIFEE